MKSQKICCSQQCKLWKICSKHSLEPLTFPFLCIPIRQMSPNYCLIQFFEAYVSVGKVSTWPHFFFFSIEYIQKKSSKIPSGGENSLQPSLQLSTLIIPSSPSSTLTHGKEYSSGLDGFYTSHISKAWGGAPQPSIANKPHITRSLVWLSSRSTKITHGHRNKCTSHPPKCT